MNQVLIPGSLSDGDGLATNEVLECTSRFIKMNWCERAEPFNQIKGHTIGVDIPYLFIVFCHFPPTGHTISNGHTIFQL